MFLCDNRELGFVTRQCLSSPRSLLGLIWDPITISKVCCSLRYQNNTDLLLITPVLKTGLCLKYLQEVALEEANLTNCQ